MDESIVLLHPPLDQSGDNLATLIRAAQADPLAFAELYHSYVDRIYAYLRARTDNVDEAHDLTQQVFLRALDALPRYRGGSASFPAWIFRIARNSAANAGSRRHPTVALDLVDDFRHPVADSDPEATALRHETSTYLHTLLAALPPDKREILALRFAGGLTVGEISNVIGKSEAATRKQLARTLQTLQEHYHDTR